MRQSSEIAKTKNAERFSDRVANYVKYRPSYPKPAIDYLFENGIDKNSVICDIGSGTGILSKILIEQVCIVYGIEPNDKMRHYAEEDLKQYTNFKSLLAIAEDTGLKNNSVDAITAAQAFHWFDRSQCKKEFNRILKPDGKIFLIWNNRINNTKFLKEYDGILYQYGVDYSTVNHQNLTDEIFAEFFNGQFEKKTFDNHQDFSLEEFLGRVFSSSYTPLEGHPHYELFLDSLHAIYKKYNKNGIVKFNYQTEVILGKLI